MNLSHPKNFEAVTEAYDGLSKTIGRFSFVRATIITLIALALASALQEVGSSEANSIVTELGELVDVTRESPELPDVFLAAIYGPTLSNRSRPEPEEDNTSSDQPAAERPTPSQEEITKAQARTRELIAKLKGITDSAFTFAFRAPLVGTDVKLDLRIWGFLLPLVVILSEIYLWVLRYKRGILHGLGRLLTQSQPASTTAVYSLRFVDPNHTKPAFTRHPGEFELVCTLIGGLALLIYMSHAGLAFWNGWDPFSRYLLVDFYAVFIVYAIAYVAHVKRQLDRQIATVEGLRPPRSPILEPLHRAVAWTRLVARRLRPRLRLSTGSVMVLGTLWLLVAAPWGCEPKTGLGYLQKPKGWLVGPICGFGAETTPHNYLIAALYVSGLLVAAATLLILFGSLISRRLLLPNKLVATTGGLATVVYLFFVSDLSFGHVLDLTNLAEAYPGAPPVWPVIWLAVFALWPLPIFLSIWFANTRDSRRRAAWPGVRLSLRRWYAPQIGVAAIVTAGTLFQNHKLIGVPIFVLGMGLIANSYATLSEPKHLDSTD